MLGWSVIEFGDEPKKTEYHSTSEKCRGEYLVCPNTTYNHTFKFLKGRFFYIYLQYLVTASLLMGK